MERTYDQTQAMAGCYLTRDKGKAIEVVQEWCSAVDEFRMVRTFSVARSHPIERQPNGSTVEPDLVNGNTEVCVGLVNGQPQTEPEEPTNFGGLLERFAVVYESLAYFGMQHSLVDAILRIYRAFQFRQADVTRVVGIPIWPAARRLCRKRTGSKGISCVTR